MKNEYFWMDLVSTEKELWRAINLYISAKEKIENPKFLENAPEKIIEKEREKLHDSLLLIDILQKKSVELWNMCKNL